MSIIDARPITPAILAALDIPATGATPTFSGGAATVAPGTDKAVRYVLPASATLTQASTLTLATTGSPVVGNKLIMCLALSLGYTLSIVNGGPLGGTLATIPASITRPRGVMLWFDGTNYTFNGYVEGN